MSEESSGGTCDYYAITVKHSRRNNGIQFVTDPSELSEVLELTCHEGVILKEIVRQANARKGKQKAGNTALRGAQKMHWAALRILEIEKLKDSGEWDE